MAATFTSEKAFREFRERRNHLELQRAERRNYYCEEFIYEVTLLQHVRKWGRSELGKIGGKVRESMKEKKSEEK